MQKPLLADGDAYQDRLVGEKSESVADQAMIKTLFHKAQYHSYSLERRGDSDTSTRESHLRLVLATAL